MIYNIVYSAEAGQDLRGIYEYIAYELLEPGTATGQMNRNIKNVKRQLSETIGGKNEHYIS